MTKEPTGTNKGKDTIYIDVDDEITGIIEKVQNSSQRIVALVLPKRATMLQSAVNMKLLKRAGEKSQKHVVLITSEAALMPLAGSVGLHVSKTLQSKPEIPETPEASKAAAEPSSDAEPAAAGSDEPSIDKRKPVGELAGDDDDDEAIELDNSADAEAAEDTAEGGKKEAGSKAKGDKKIKIPNFHKFRTWVLVGGVGVLALIGFAVWALITMPRGEVVIATDSSAIVSSREITLVTDEDAELDAEEGILPAQIEEITRTQRAEVDATGEENHGDHATGQVDMEAGPCSPTAPAGVPEGTGITANGMMFITQETAEFGTEVSGGQCHWVSEDIEVRAQNPGSEYNIDSTTFSVAGRSDVSAESSEDMSGGTDDIVTIVTQADIDRAQEQIAEREADEVEQELQDAVSGTGLFALPATFDVTTDDTETSADPGDEADSVTVTEDVVYTMAGVEQDDLEAIIAADVADDIDTERQIILDYGLAEATFNMQNQQDDRITVGMRTVVVAGPDLDTDTIKEDVAGKKASEARSLIGVNPGVVNVDVTYGPFWVRSMPSNTDKITVTIEEPETVVEHDDDSGDDDDAASEEE